MILYFRKMLLITWISLGPCFVFCLSNFFPDSTSCFQFPTKKEMLVLCDTCNVVELLLSYDNIYYVKFLANTLFTFFLHWRTVDVKRNNCIFKNELGFQVLHNSLFQLCLGIFFFTWKHNMHFILNILMNSSVRDESLWRDWQAVNFEN